MLKDDKQGLLNGKNLLQREVQAASDYILGLEAKCFQANQTSLSLIKEVRQL